MSAISTTRRDVLATAAAAGAFSLIAEQMPQAAEGNIAIRPFHNINVSETALVDLRRRIAATQWPERETVADQSQGVHPGEEIVYVVEGALEYALAGRPPVTLKAGDVLFIPAGTPHAVKNVGNGKAAELATYIVEKASRSSRPS